MLEHDKLKSMVSRATDMTEEAREMSERDRDYYDHYQWTAEEIAILKRRKQPIITKNRIQRKIDAMVGLEQRGRVDPAAYPRTPNDEDAADVATKVLRYVEERERVDQIRSAVFYNELIEGYGGAEVVAEMRAGQIEVAVKRIRWEELFFDPHSREKDFSDAAYMGVQKWMSEDRALEFATPFWDGDEDDLRALMDTQSTDIGHTYEDRPQDVRMAWADKRLRRVRIAQMYYLYGGVWHLCIFTGKGEIYNEVSPYTDEDGRPDNPMVLTSAYIDRENRRYGVVRSMISAQDEINKRTSKYLHGINSRQTLAVKGALDSVEAFKREMASPDGHIELNIEAFEDAARAGIRPFEVLQNNDQLAGQANLLREAKDEIDMVGPNASLLGQLQGQQSGRAIMAQQQAGLAELAPVYDGLADWTERLYLKIWNRVRQFWDGPRWIRITDDEEAPQFVGINQVQQGPDGQMAMVNPIAQIDVDIIVKSSPEYVTLRHEQFDKLAELAQSGYPIPPDVLIEASDLRDKRKLIEKMTPPPEQQQAQAQMQQMAAQVEMAVKEAKAARDMAAAQKDMASLPNVQSEAAETQADTMKTVAQTQAIVQENRLAPVRLQADLMRRQTA